MAKCTLCGETFRIGGFPDLASHFYMLAEQSDIGHVMWLNRYITKKKTDVKTLGALLADFFDLQAFDLQT